MIEVSVWVVMILVSVATSAVMWALTKGLTINQLRMEIEILKIEKDLYKSGMQLVNESQAVVIKALEERIKELEAGNVNA